MAGRFLARGMANQHRRRPLREGPETPENNWIWSAQGVIDMHRPERWGYVQFARAATAPFVPDVSVPARDALHDVYYAQRSFRKQNGRWAGSLQELGVSPQRDDRLGPVALNLTETGWTARVALQIPGAVAEQWNIRDDARVWSGQ